MNDTCGTCAEPIEYLRSTWQVDRGTYRDPNGHDSTWFHVGGEVWGEPFHLAAPPARCPKCRSLNYVHDETDPWANYDRCGDCGYTYRFSLGD
jgi:hypothetical protein